MDAILEPYKVTKFYKNSGFMLNQVSFVLPAGVIICFVGENGAGKN
jgi:ABC-type multidrug transport system ATPase subunit